MEHHPLVTLKKIAACCILIFLFSCNKEDAPDIVKSTGAIKNEWRSTGDYHYLYVDYRTHVFIVPDAENRIEVRAGKNLLPKIITTVRNDTLLLLNNNRFNFLRNFRDSVCVTVHTNHLYGVDYHGSGAVVSLGQLQVPRFSVNSMNGSGSISLDVKTDSMFFYFNAGPADLTLSGSTNYLYLFGAGQGFLRAASCNATTVQADSRSSGDVYLRASGNLLVDISSSGSVFYYGNPAVNFKSKGTGKLIPLQ